MKTLFYLFLCCLLYGQLSAQENRKGKDIAVFFAIEDYKNPWPKLNNPIKEAEELQTILKNDYGFETEMYKNGDLKAIMQQLETLLKRQYAEDGQLLIFFSGHGEFRELTKEGFFIPANATEEMQYLDYTRLRKKVDAIPCKHVLLMIDACYAGTFDDRVAYKGRPDDLGEEPQINIAELLKNKTRYFAASAAKERSPDKSEFVAHLIHALRQPPTDGILTLGGVRTQLEKIEPQPYFNEFGNHLGGNFLFISTEVRTHFENEISIPVIRNKQDVNDVSEDEKRAWLKAQSSNTLCGYNLYLKQYKYYKLQAQEAMKIINSRINELENKSKQNIKNGESKLANDFQMSADKLKCD